MIILSEDIYLNVAMTMHKSLANGPGKRAVIWVQGCTIGCRGCYNAFTHPHKIETLASPKKLADWINSIDDIEGLTFSGGEPFEQAEAVAEVIDTVNSSRNHPLSIFIFTGFDLEELLATPAPAVQRLLSLTDMLSAGPFLIGQCDTNLLWRGSSNQQLVYLSERYAQSEEEKWGLESPVEELILNANLLQRTGFAGPQGDLVKAFEAIE